MRSGYSLECLPKNPEGFLGMGNSVKFGSTTFRYGVRQLLNLSLSETLAGLASSESADAGSDKRF
jgi:hypothetical protein